MRDYARLFEAIGKTMHHDYAGFEGHPAHGRASLYAGQLMRLYRLDRLDDSAFAAIAEEYLSEYRDPNLRLVAKNTDSYTKTVCGFRARRFEDGLIVTEAREEKRLKPGDVITAINRMPVARIAASGSPVLRGDTPERELWDMPLDGAWSYTLADGTELKAEKYPWRQPECGLSLCREEGGVLITLSVSPSSEETEGFFAEHAGALCAAPRLILDLRRAGGGDPDAFFPLAPYVADRPQKRSELLGDGGAFVNYSAGNCRLWREAYRAFAESAGDGRAVLAELLSELDEKEGRGFLFEPEEALGEADETVEPAGPPRTVILTDRFCTGEAERFVCLAGRSPRVTVLGRRTAGGLAYCRPVLRRLDGDFALLYPTAKSALGGAEGSGGAVEPDEAVPWTPEELREDPVLRRALSL